MIPVSEITGHWFGLCRKPPALHASHAAIVYPSEPAHEGLPDGGGGRFAGIRRGIGAALAGMRTLNRNRQLLWFSLLAGLVLAGNTICQGVLWYLTWIMADRIVPLVLGFCIELATQVCLMFLLAGLVLSISSKKESQTSFFTELAGAKKYKKAIFLWSFVLAFAGVLFDRVFFNPGGIFWPLSSSLLSLLTEFPFSLNLNPSTFAEIPGYGGRSLLFWTYPYGFGEALTFSAINLLLFILTAFVIPLIVLEQKTIREAVAGSFAIMKKIWVELTASVVFLGIVVSVVFLTYLLVQAAHGMVTPPELLYDRPTGTWLGLGLLYYLVVFSIALVAATVGGIAALDLYRSVRSRQMPGSPEPEPCS